MLLIIILILDMIYFFCILSENVLCMLVGKGYGGEVEIGVFVGLIDKINKK